MEFAGIIAEYDPFHNGHAAQLQMLRARGAGRIAVCISAAAVQRGGFPLLPEPVRVQAALQAGADLVAALPAPYACLGAEGFAAAGVALLTALGCDTLAFGAETPDVGLLMRAARLVDSSALAEGLQRHLAGGATFAAARAAAAEELEPGTGALLASPNNILGVEYCKAILRQGSHLQPLPLPRLAAGHGTAETGAIQGRPVASASYLRELAWGQGLDTALEFVPAQAAALYRASADRGELLDPDKFSVAVLSRLRGQGRQQLAAVRGLSEGLENRLYAAVQKASTAQELYDLLKTRRYPHARLRRLVLDAALGVTEGLVPQTPPYLHVLGARRQALGALRYAALPAGTSLAELARGSAPAEAVAQLHRPVGPVPAAPDAGGACIYGQARDNIVSIWRKRAPLCANDAQRRKNCRPDRRTGQGGKQWRCMSWTKPTTAWAARTRAASRAARSTPTSRKSSAC